MTISTSKASSLFADVADRIRNKGLVVSEFAVTSERRPHPGAIETRRPPDGIARDPCAQADRSASTDAPSLPSDAEPPRAVCRPVRQIRSAGDAFVAGFTRH